MPDCDYCDKEFDEEEEMHIHWLEEHEEEITSHEKDKAKKAKKQKKQKDQEKMRKRKQVAGWALAGVLAWFVVGYIVTHVNPSLTGADSEEVDAQELEDLLEDRPVIGDEDAEVTVVEFGDYLCPHCRDFEFNTKEPLMEDGYFEDGDVNFYYLHFPVVDPEGSRNAAIAAECVAEQDKEQFWDYTTALFENQQEIQYNAAELTDLAEESTEGLDYDELQSCIRNEDTEDIVERDQQFGQSQGIRGTPTVYINGNQVSDWDYQNMANLIDAELERAN